MTRLNFWAASAIAAVMTATVMLTTVSASPPAPQRHSHRPSGGGVNWGNVVNQAIQGAARAHQQQQHHQPVQPRYITPQPRYVTPQPRIMQPTPHVNHVPHIPSTNVVPHVNVYTPTPVTPRVNVVPQPTVTKPLANSVPQTQAAARPVVPMPNPLPQPGTVPVPAPAAVPVPAPANANLTNWVANLSREDIDQIISQLGERDQNLADRARAAALRGVDDAIDNLPNADQLTPADRRRIREAIERGDPDAVRDLLGDRANSPAGENLIDRAASLQMIDRIRQRIVDRLLTGAELGALIAIAQGIGLAAAELQAFVDLIAQIAINQQLIDWLMATLPGVGNVPFGPDIPIVLVPGLPEGLMMPLDGGPVMIGMGAPGDAVMLGTGNPAEVAGLPVAVFGAEPVPAGGPVTAGQIILGNRAEETINYNLNQQPFQMQKGYEQTLPTGTTWVVEFDRGGNFGMARYQLSEGTYYFTATEKGWELFRMKFNAALDNTGNTFAFNYVVDNQQQTLAAGESQTLTGIYPTVVRFDSGGQEKQRRLDNGSYKVALGDDGKFDIYAAASVISPQPAQLAPASSALASTTGQPEAAPAPAPSSAVAVVDPAKATAPAPIAKAEPAAQAASSTQARRLPAGFKLFDPVKGLTDKETARRLPASFKLFSSAAEALQAANTQ